MNRDQVILNLRPNIKTIKSDLMSSDQEKFQNEVIRPIVKFQHELIIDIFKDYLHEKKIQLDLLSTENQIIKITRVVQKDRTLTIQLQSIIIAYFTLKEYKQFNLMQSSMKKRIAQIIRERIINTLVK